MERLSVSQVARRLGSNPKDISDLFYRRELSDEICPVVAGRRLIPKGYIPTIEAAMEKVGRAAIRDKHPICRKDAPFSKRAASPGPRPYARDAAAKWLREALADGPMPAKEIKAAAGRAGLSEITLSRAKKAVGVRATKGLQGEGWSWELPEASKPSRAATHSLQGGYLVLEGRRGIADGACRIALHAPR